MILEADNLTEDLIRQLGELKEKANDARKQRDEYNEIAKKYAEERDAKNTVIASLLAQAKEKKSLRDKLNSNVADLKAKREELEKTNEQLLKEYDKLKEELNTLNPPKTPLKTLVNRVKDLEWKLQTSVISLEREKDLVKEISELEKLIETKKKAEALKNQIILCKTQIGANKLLLRNIKNGVVSSAKSSQSEHTTMTGIYKQVDDVRKQADEFHNKFVEAKKKADEFHTQYLEARKEMKKIIDQIHQLKLKDKKEREKLIELKLNQMIKTAQEKLKSGEKLSFEEFQVLMEKGLI